MGDLRRERDAARRERDQLRRENADLRAILGDIDPAYATAYRDLCDLALHGLRRPDDLGGPITTGHAASKPPEYHPAAYDRRNQERRLQRARAAEIRRLLDRLTGEKPVERRHQNATPVMAQPSHSHASVAPRLLDYRFSVRRAPSGAPQADPT